MLRFPAGIRCSLQCFLTGPGSHPASSLEAERQGHGADDSDPSNAEAKNERVFELEFSDTSVILCAPFHSFNLKLCVGYRLRFSDFISA